MHIQGVWLVCRIAERVENVTELVADFPKQLQLDILVGHQSGGS